MGANLDPLILLRTLQQANGANPHGGYPASLKLSIPATDANLGEISVLLEQLDGARLDVSVPAGRGQLTRIPVVTPAAGAEWTITVPAGQTWEIFSVVETLTASASAANRVPALVIDDGTNVLLASVVTNVTANIASVVVFANYGGGVSNGNGLGYIGGAIPGGIILPGGYRVRSSTANIQVGDAYTAVAVWAYVS